MNLTLSTPAIIPYQNASIKWPIILDPTNPAKRPGDPGPPAKFRRDEKTEKWILRREGKAGRTMWVIMGEELKHENAKMLDEVHL